jgi:hypothetical protein
MILDLRSQMADTGCIFIPKLYDAALTGRMRVICEHVLSQWRIKSAEDGKPGIEDPGSAIMRHLNHPGYFAGRREWLVELLDAVADPRVLGVVREVFQDEVLFRCTSLFMNPLETSRDGNWHRDSQFVTPTEEADRAMVEELAGEVKRTRTTTTLQLQIALVPTDDSEYVPGSHLRWDTPEENFIRKADGGKHCTSSLMPGAARTHQEPGDAAAFNAFGLHRGRYHADRYRRTLMLTYTAMGTKRTRDYFSDQPWCLEPGYLDGVKPETRVLFERFIQEYRDYWGRKR